MKLLLILLAVVNVLFLGATQGWLGNDVRRFARPEQREPIRVAQQVAPNKIEILSAARVAPPACVEFSSASESEAERLTARIKEVGATTETRPAGDDSGRVVIQVRGLTALNNARFDDLLRESDIARSDRGCSPR